MNDIPLSRKALIVEDEVLSAHLFRLWLTNIGYHVLDLAATGKEACEIAARDAPDVVFMDIGLASDMDGVEAAIRINDQRKTPVCFITGFPVREVKERVCDLPARVVGVLEKPVNEGTLRRLVEAL